MQLAVWCIAAASQGRERRVGWWVNEEPPPTHCNPPSLQVFYAPHIARLSAALGARFEIRYTLRDRGELISNVIYTYASCKRGLPEACAALLIRLQCW